MEFARRQGIAALSSLTGPFGGKSQGTNEVDGSLRTRPTSWRVQLAECPPMLSEGIRMVDGDSRVSDLDAGQRRAVTLKYRKQRGG